VLALALSLIATAAARVNADIHPADEQSLANGAQLYEVFCSECHGSDATHQYGQLYASPEVRAEDEYDRMIATVQQEEAAQLIVVPEEEDEWPEWAERPDPDAEKAPDEKAEVMNTLTAVIDEVHGIKPAPASPGANAGNPAGDAGLALSEGTAQEQGPPGGFEPVPGAPNLADPASFYYGTSEEELFESIADGTGRAMPGFRTELGGDDAIRDVVNYIRSFWREEWLY